MRALTRSLVVLVAACSLLAAPSLAGASQESDAGKAVQKYLKAAFAGKWAKTYGYLPDAQSDLFSESDWAECQERRNGHLVGGKVKSFEVTGSTEEPDFAIPGTDEQADALAVDIKVTASLDGQTQSEDDTVHVVKQGKQWRPSVTEAQVVDCQGGGDISSTPAT